MKTINETIQNVTETARKAFETTLAEHTKNVEQIYQAAALLAPLDILVPVNEWSRYGETVELKDVKDISKVVKAIGPIKKDGGYVRNDKKRLIVKTFRSVHFPALRMNVQVKLPSPKSKAGKAMKCKIVRTRQTVAALVCSAK